MKLHIGGRTPAPGWAILDIRAGPHVDIVCDTGRLAFAADTIEAIYASHVLEHLARADILPALREWLRVLAPGGEAMISVPDMQTLARLYADPAALPQLRSYLSGIIFGSQQNPHEFHRAGLDHDILGFFLQEAGFRHIRRVAEFGLFQDGSICKVNGVPFSVNMRATKQAPRGYVLSSLGEIPELYEPR